VKNHNITVTICDGSRRYCSLIGNDNSDVSSNKFKISIKVVRVCDVVIVFQELYSGILVSMTDLTLALAMFTDSSTKRLHVVVKSKRKDGCGDSAVESRYEIISGVIRSSMTWNARFLLSTSRISHMLTVSFNSLLNWLSLSWMNAAIGSLS
jgi:hypothetical protein